MFTYYREQNTLLETYQADLDSSSQLFTPHVTQLWNLQFMMCVRVRCPSRGNFTGENS
jgi:hypothetical protein